MKPTISQASPAYRVCASWTTTTSHAAPVPIAPTIANSGHWMPRIVRFGRARHSSSSSGRRTRSVVTARWAIVNESMAPNAYIRPRKSTCPESRKSVGPIPAKTTSDSHGVFSLGCSLRNAAGSWR